MSQPNYGKNIFIAALTTSPAAPNLLGAGGVVNGGAVKGSFVGNKTPAI